MRNKITLKIISVARRMFRNSWIQRLRITNIIYKKLFQSTFKKAEMEIEFRGNKFIVDTTDITIVPTMMTGEYEKYELDMFEFFIQPGDTVFDVGANLGVHSITASQAAGSKGSVYCFEPVSANLKMLKTNLDLNKISNATVEPLVVSDHSDKKAKIYIQPNSVGTHSVITKSDNYETVQTITIDDYMKRHEIRSMNVIKIDVEGFEGAVIEGALGSPEKYQPKLFIEFDKRLFAQSKRKATTMVDQLFSVYSHCYSLNERKKTLAKVSPEQIPNLNYSNLLFSPLPIDSD